MLSLEPELVRVHASSLLPGDVLSLSLESLIFPSRSHLALALQVKDETYPPLHRRTLEACRNAYR